MKIILIAAGETILNTQNKVEGWSDSPLTDSGIQHALYCKNALKNIRINRVFCSSSERAIDTAEMIVKGMDIPLIINRGLKDINYGLLEASPVYILNEYNENYPDHQGYLQVKGESRLGFEMRVKDYFTEIINESNKMDQVLIVTHSNVIRTLLESMNLTKKYDTKKVILINYDENQFSWENEL